jgi:ABC-type maltose transport system permease subunit
VDHSRSWHPKSAKERQLIQTIGVSAYEKVQTRRVRLSLGLPWMLVTSTKTGRGLFEGSTKSKDCSLLFCVKGNEKSMKAKATGRRRFVCAVCDDVIRSVIVCVLLRAHYVQCCHVYYTYSRLPYCGYRTRLEAATLIVHMFATTAILVSHNNNWSSGVA